MRIWTIQTEAAWENFQERGVLRASRAHQSKNWPEAYAWIEEQLIRRVGPPPAKNIGPLWGWYHWAGAAKKRPDLRAVRFHYGPPGRYVLIECELPAQAVILSDFQAWHIILNEGYVGLDDDDDAEYDNAKKRHDANPSDASAARLRRDYYESWERIIDMEQLTAPYHDAMEQKSIQACFWQLERDQVISCKAFTSVPTKL